MIFWIRSSFVFSVILLLSACATQKESVVPPYLDQAYPWQEEAHKILVALNEGEVDRASMLANLALQRFPREPALHTLNGLAYEYASAGGSQHHNNELAEMAYKTALNLDPNNWYTLYRMGRLQVGLDNYVGAQQFFIRAIKIRPKDPQLFYEMAYASYYAEDLPCAYVSIQRALEYLPEQSTRRPLFLRAAALIASAAGKPKLVATYREELEKSQGCDRDDLVLLGERIDRWSKFHQNLSGGMLKRASLLDDDQTIPPSAGAVSLDDSSGDGSLGGGSGTTAPIAPPLTSQEEKEPVIIFECVLLSLEEQVDTQKGQNLLKQFQGGLAMTQDALPSGLATQGPSSITTSYTKDLAGNLIPDSNGNLGTRVFSRSISWGPISYNANILNVTNQRIETLSRPILSGFIGQPASFASGRSLVAGLTGSSGGSLVSLPVGTVITITATSVQGKHLDVDIDMETSTPTTIDNTASLASQVMEIRKARVKTKMRLTFNETGMVGGNYERDSSYTKDGVPLLEKIPLVQYFFASERNSGKKKSILFLVTPRRPRDAEEKMKEYHGLKRRHENWSGFYKFLKEHNPESMLELEDMGIFYDESINKLAFYFRGDMVRMPDENLKSSIGSIRNFIYY
jgi:tetratricopeptide (TPR) repeat protein